MVVVVAGLTRYAVDLLGINRRGYQQKEQAGRSGSDEASRFLPGRLKTSCRIVLNRQTAQLDRRIRATPSIVKIYDKKNY